MDIGGLERRLGELADPVYRQFTAKLIPTIDPARILGVRMPALRKLARELAGTPAAEALMAGAPHRYLEEEHLHGLLVNALPGMPETVAALDALLPFVDNWATCDLLKPAAFKRAAHTPEGCARLEREAYRWMADGRAYTRRFGVSVLMNFLLDDGFDPAQLEAAAAIPQGDYYVDMMVAWYVATALANRWEQTIPLIEGRRLPAWTHRKAIQKARESFRVPDERKARLAAFR